jgi:asparagine synthase (glutamine-hydrolysing)
MCGISGWLFAPGTEPAPEILEHMSEAIRHRGPDDQGIYRDSSAGVALAFRRLSIIDLTAASHQPMVDAGSGVVMVYNGELYNFGSLRLELQALGHAFVSRGDAEVVLKSFLQWGVDCFRRFAGMFALALWDGRTATLHLARDPMGMKPLYYVRRPQGLVFASEIKAFRTLPGFRLAPSELGLSQYLEFGYVFDEQRTFLEGVSK